MRLFRFVCLVMLATCVGGCGVASDENFYVFDLDYAFDSGTSGWTGDFANFSTEDSVASELRFEHTTLPAGLDQSKAALMLSGFNQDKSLFMFLKKKLTGLQSNTEYTLAYSIELASNKPKGGSGETIYLKAGAYTDEPQKILSNDFFSLDVNTGYLNTGGENMVVVGNVATSVTTTDYELISRTTTSSVKAYSNADGELWLIVGTDSALQELITLYYTRISVVLSISN